MFRVINVGYVRLVADLLASFALDLESFYAAKKVLPTVLNRSNGFRTVSAQKSVLRDSSQ